MIIKHSSNHGHMGLTGADGQFLREFKIGDNILTTEKRDGKYDAMICWWEFTEEFLNFRGPKLFYCCEPSFYFRGWRSSKRELRRRLQSLRADEFSWHYHENPKMRVEHETSDFSDRARPLGRNEIKNAVIVLNNLGNALMRNRGRQMRAEFVVHSGCDIFGPQKSWERFQKNIFSKKGFPVGYKGECPIGCKLEFISRYHACICLENSCEPLYFTEKFPDAVRAGCVPIYHPHPVVKERFLNGAVWVDPVDYQMDPVLTIQAALQMNREQVAVQNFRWLKESAALETTKVENIYIKMVDILKSKITGEINLPRRATRTNLPDEYFQLH